MDTPHLNMKDFAGHRQGSLTIKKYTNKRLSGSVVWLCECDCGNITYKSARHLMNSKPAMKCGRECTLDIKGKKFGMLTVEGIETNWRLISGDGFPIKCRCDCGEIIYTSRNRLKHKYRTNCGCQKLQKGEARFNELYYSYTKQAEKRGYEFNLTKDQVRKLFESNCYYCDSLPKNFSKSRWGNGDYKYNGIDRFNNEPYYNTENVVSCCKTCNSAKMSMEAQEFFEWVERVYNHRIKNRSDF